MPATGAIARTAVNVRAGARTRLAAVVHAIVLLVVVLFAGLARRPHPPRRARRRAHGHRRAHGRRAQRAGRAAVDPVATPRCWSSPPPRPWPSTSSSAVEIGIAVAARPGAAPRRPQQPRSPLSGSPPEVDRRPGARPPRRAHRRVPPRRRRCSSAPPNASSPSSPPSATCESSSCGSPTSRPSTPPAAHALGEIVDDLEHRHITVLLKGARPEHLRILGSRGRTRPPRPREPHLRRPRPRRRPRPVARRPPSGGPPRELTLLGEHHLVGHAYALRSSNRSPQSLGVQSCAGCSLPSRSSWHGVVA